ncbi:hypothetical protein RFG39_001560 [Klebsiella aerogenes]|nr:hypothetical protein [Klebsiella aerogenes]
MNLFTAVFFLTKQVRRTYTFAGMAVLLSACTQTESKIFPDHGDGKSNYPLPYVVTLSSTKDDQMLCVNCGNTGQTTLVTGGEKLSAYHMMVDTPYYAFLCTRQEQECRSGKWIAINKNLPHPVVNNIDISSHAEIADLRPFNTSLSTWLKVYYKDGSVRDFKFENTR